MMKICKICKIEYVFLLFLTFCNFWNIHSLLDNDKPTITTSNEFPVEHKDSVILTCHSNTNDVVEAYKWYKDGNIIAKSNSTTNTYSLVDNTRSNSGSFECRVHTTHAGISESSEKQNVTFLCKSKTVYHLY